MSRTRGWVLAGLYRAAAGGTGGVSLKAATLNIYNGADLLHDLNLIASEADLVGLDEVGS
ncbi:hypothetical protein AB0J74_10895 [Asanoa sp. NPDC049573]|uniref:hypothetical protein n=1 Tax=Asanoa sp. NPDC049573 TaxID=3155396 RepID=UPI00342BCF65